MTLWAAPALAQTPGASPAPTPSDAVTTVTDTVQRYTDLGRSLLAALLLALALLLIPVVAYRVARLRRTPQLVLVDAADGGGAGMKNAAGLGQVVRERLVADLAAVRRIVDETIAEGRFLSRPLNRVPLDARTSPDRTLADLLSSVTGVLGGQDKPAGAAMKLLQTTLLRPTGTRVAPTLQALGGTPPRLGVTFAIADLRDEDAPLMLTLLEPRRGGERAVAANRPPHTPGEAPARARTYRRVGERLSRTGMIDEAERYLERAFSLEPASEETAQLLELNRSMRRRRAAALAAFAEGERLAPTDLPGAVRHYAAPLPPELRFAASVHWALALDAANDRRAVAYLDLVELYNTSLGLFEITARLLEQAILARSELVIARVAELAGRSGGAEILIDLEPADDPARVDPGLALAQIRRDAGLALWEGANRLVDLGEADDARRCLRRALALVPGHGPSVELLAHVDATTRSLNGTAGQAPPPTQPEAATEPAVDERYLDLFTPAARLLSLELLRRELRRDQDRRLALRLSPVDVLQWGLRAARSGRRRRDEGLIHNYVGMLMLASSGLGGATARASGLQQELLDRAAQEFRAASRLIPTYYQPLANLGDTHYLTAAAAGDPAGEPGPAALRRLRMAADAYAMAVGILESRRSDLDPDQYRTAERLLLAGQAVAWLRTREEGDASKALERVAAAETGLDWRTERSYRLLYNLAAAYSLAAERRTRLEAATRRGTEDERAAARRALIGELSLEDLVANGRRYLAASLGRDLTGNYGGLAGSDPDVAALRQGGGLRPLLVELVRLRASRPCLPTEGDGAAFEDRVVSVLLRTAGWARPRGGP